MWTLLYESGASDLSTKEESLLVVLELDVIKREKERGLSSSKIPKKGGENKPPCSREWLTGNKQFRQNQGKRSGPKQLGRYHHKQHSLNRGLRGKAGRSSVSMEGGQSPKLREKWTSVT